MSEIQKLFALLIDGDNAQTAFISHILRKMSDYGEPRISRVFHNKATIEQWEQIARDYPIEPIWVPNNITHKNSVDIALVMDAMMLLYERPEITGFCIVTSDSDYTRLARHLKSRGKYVLGVGKKQTPLPFLKACTEFVYVEDLESAPAPAPLLTRMAEQEVAPIEEMNDGDITKWFVKAYKHAVKNGAVNDADGWAQLRDIRETMVLLHPEFQSSSFYKSIPILANKMKSLAESAPRIIEIDEQKDNKIITHRVRVFRRDRKLDKVRAAYNLAVTEQKATDKTAWVTLSKIGTMLLKLYPDDDPLVYDGTKYSKLKKMVEQMVTDYPSAIELNTDGADAQIRMK
jgi:uncharacterized protein (TIGR00288 family)